MQTKVMGVLCVAPDSFADGDRSPDRAATARGREMVSEGADIVEVRWSPAISGHPPAHSPTAARQVRGAVAALTGDIRVAVRTDSATVAAAAVGAGATLIIDDSMIPLPAEPPGSLPALAAEAGIGWVAVHGHGTAAQRSGAGNGDASDPASLFGEVAEALRARAEQAEAAGVKEIYIDPGIGTGRAVQADLDLLGGLELLKGLERPLVVGTGDGRLVDALHAAAGAKPAPPVAFDGTIGSGAGRDEIPGGAGRQDHNADHLEGALVVAVWAMLAGAAIIRTHHVAATVEAARVVGAKPPVGAP